MKNITLYTTHCPVCLGVEKLLHDKHVSYDECTDVETMALIGMRHAPMLVVDGERLTGKAIFDWVKENC